MKTVLSEDMIRRRYDDARMQYKNVGVDTDAVLDRLAGTPISIQCWQGDDVHGFEVQEEAVAGGGIMSTGAYPGVATDPQMLRRDAEKAFSLIPGSKRFSLHAIYAETGGRAVSRDQLTEEHFANWMKWSRDNNIPLDFNPTFFAHPLANDGFTLSHPDPEIRNFWVRHDKCCRRIAEAFGRNQGGVCIVNHWIPDGAKDQPFDRWSPRKRLTQSLEDIFSEKIDPEFCRDAVESKLFGIGSEDYVVGSHEYYMGYALTHPQMLCLDMGHFHPTETIHDKISAIFQFKDELLLHVSRGVRWDSDHVVILNDDVRNLFQQIVRGGVLDKVHIGLDFFDGSINRIGAWVIGTRAAQKGILQALLEPGDMLREFEDRNDGAMRLAMLEELKFFPANDVWNMFCLSQNVPAGPDWMNAVMEDDREVIRKR